MSLHRVHLRYDESATPAFHDRLPVWLTNMEPWAAAPNEVPPLAPAHDGE
jgi:hypothetical protein